MANNFDFNFWKGALTFSIVLAIGMTTCFSCGVLQGQTTFRTVVLTSDTVPGTAPGVTFDNFNPNPVIGENGDVSFRSTLAGTGVDDTNDQAIFSSNGGVLQLVAREGAVAAGIGGGARYSDLREMLIDDFGQTAFRTTLIGGGVDFTNNEVIYSQTSGSLGVAARLGDLAPGIGSDVNFQFFNQKLFLNGQGEVAFRASIEGPGVNASNMDTIFTGTPGSMRLVARSGDQAPGAEPGATFDNTFLAAVNDQGQALFFTGLGGNNADLGVFKETVGVTELVARTGDQAPGV